MNVAELIFDGPEGALPIVVLAHGAGAPMDSPFMAWFAGRLAADGHRVARFEFPYMAARRTDGKRRPPNAAGRPPCGGQPRPPSGVSAPGPARGRWRPEW